MYQPEVDKLPIAKISVMKILTYILKHFIIEVFIIIILIFLINNFIGNTDNTIKADGVGYYDYLPSIFIHHDILRKDNPIQKGAHLYNRIISTGVYKDYNDFKVNKYPCGTALLQLPFFTYAYFTSKHIGGHNNGYQQSFQKAIFYAAIFYLFLSILFLKKILILYKIKKHVIIFCQLTIVLSTAVIHYTYYDAGFSHIYSLFAITAFIYVIKSFFLDKKINHFVIACLLLGLIFILRQPNLLIILFIPFIAGSLENLKIGIRTLFINKRILILGIVLFFGMFSIQSVLWYMQTGYFFTYSYQGESFNFLDPHFFSILFSYKKGLFIYTPILLFSLISIIWFAFKKYFYLFFTWVSFFLIVTYVLSSWWSWFYGCSYGLRAYIDYYTVFFIPIAFMLNGINVIPRILIMILALPTIPLNIIQTYQYKEYILHWIDMDKKKYWKVFLKTEDRFKGLVWKNNYDSNQYSTLDEIYIGDIFSPKNSTDTLLNINSLEICEFNKVSIIQVLIDNEYSENSDTKIIVNINKPSNDYNYFWYECYLIHFHEKNLNEWQTGFFNYEFNPIVDNQENIISLEVKAGDQNEYLKNVRIKFLSNIIANNK